MQQIAQEIYSFFRKEILGETGPDTLRIKQGYSRDMNSAEELSPDCISGD